MTKKISFYGLFAALAILLGYFDLLIPNPIPIPGFKLGLANIVVVIVLYLFGLKSAIFISIVRIILSGFLFSGFNGILYSFAGGLFSLLAMRLAKNIKIFSVAGVSIIGSIFHNVGQVICASIIVKNVKLMVYVIPLLITSILTGLIIGIAAKNIVAFFNKYRL